MAKAPRWKATRTKKQSIGLGIVWAVLAIVTWLLVALPSDAGWWSYVLGVIFTVQAVFYLNSWRLWRPEWDAG